MLRLVLSILLLFSSPAFAVMTITQGDTPTFTLTAQNGDGTNYDLTGAVFTTQILGKAGTIVTLANAAHTADADQTTNKGKFTLVLTAANTQALLLGPEHEIVTKVVQGSLVTYFHAPNILTVLPPRPTK